MYTTTEKSVRDSLDKAILGIVKEFPEGIRLVDISRKLSRGMMTVKYRLLIMEREGDVQIERGHRLLKAYPPVGKEASA